MYCPECGTSKLRALETRVKPDNTIFRRRLCTSCGNRFKTMEVISDSTTRPPRKKARRKPGPRKGTKRQDNSLPYGSRNPASVLTENDVLRLRHQASRGTPTHRLATEYGIAPSTVSRIIHRKAWTHI